MTYHNLCSSAAVAALEEFPCISPKPISRAAQERISLAVVSRFDEDLVSLLEILYAAGYAVHFWTNCEDALFMLRDHPVPVLICDRELTDWTWQKLLLRINRLPENPHFIVSARSIDEALRLEAMSLGVHDVLRKPFDAADVIRVIESSRKSWRLNRAGTRSRSLPADSQLARRVFTATTATRH